MWVHETPRRRNLHGYSNALSGIVVQHDARMPGAGAEAGDERDQAKEQAR